MSGNDPVARAQSLSPPAGHGDLYAAPRIMGAGAAHAVGRFGPGGTIGYRAASAPNAPLRATRGEAVSDEREWLNSAHRFEKAAA